MGIFNFLFKSKHVNQTNSNPLSNSKANQQSPNATAQYTVSNQKTNKNDPIKVLNREEIKKAIQIESEATDISMELYCPVLPARIFCHSVLIDKLGDLTKFIISSLYMGHSIDEISSLTQMGTSTINEEISYMKRGGLIDNEERALTSLGLQYGLLLKKFDELNEGIAVALNTFANIFEKIEERGYIKNAEPKYTLPTHYISVLTRNDNYANSLDLALEQIEEDIPFSLEIKNSLYTTVEIKNTNPGYKKVVIRDFRNGLNQMIANEASIKIAIPYDHVLIQPRYSWLDLYRDSIEILNSLGETHAELLSDKADSVLKAVQEEATVKKIIIDINTVTGELNNSDEVLVELPTDEKVFILNRPTIKLKLSPSCEGFYIEEVDRKKLCKIKYFTYSQMEVV